MTTSKDVQRQILIGVVAAVVVAALSTLAGILVGDLRDHLDAIPWVWTALVALAAMFVGAISLRDIPQTSAGHALRALGPSLSAIAAYLALVGWGVGNQPATMGTLAALAALATLALGVLIEVRSYARSTREEIQGEIVMGFATTGILISHSERDRPKFLLVYNRNLRGGEGLFVPPGGHFDPRREDPVIRLKDKVRAEIALESTVWDHGPFLRPDTESRNTQGARWIDPPTFVLEEDLFGKCSHGHQFHHDYVYILESNGVPITGIDPKYPDRDRIEVYLRDCLPNVETARQAVARKADDWFVQQTGRKPALGVGVTDDLVWRLHLAAASYLQEGNNGT